MTFELRIVAVVDVFVGARPPAQEALLVRLLHMVEQLIVAVEGLAAEAAGGVPLEARLRQRPRQVATPRVHLHVRRRVHRLLRDEHLGSDIFGRLD